MNLDLLLQIYRLILCHAFFHCVMPSFKKILNFIFFLKRGRYVRVKVWAWFIASKQTCGCLNFDPGRGLEERDCIILSQLKARLSRGQSIRILLNKASCRHLYKGGIVSYCIIVFVSFNLFNLYYMYIVIYRVFLCSLRIVSY